MACFFISLKTSNYLLHIKFIIDKFCEFEKIQSEEEKSKIKDKVLAYESDILIRINFSLEYELPYPFLKKILGLRDQAVLKFIIKNEKNAVLSNFCNDNDKIKHIKGKISEIVNFSFLFPFFLNFNTDTISLSCLKLALNKLKIQININDIINIICNQKEKEFVSIDVNDINDIEICSSLIDELVLSKIQKVKTHEEHNVNNINNIKKQNFFIANTEYDIGTKPKSETKEKSKNETFLKKKRK